MENGKIVYYGWYIVIVAFLANVLGTGTSFYIFNAFLEPICAIRGWTRTEINIAPMLGWIVGLFAAMAFGTLVNLVGVRILMALGGILSALSFMLLGVSEKIWVFYIFFMLLYIGNGAMSGIVANTAVNNWFVSKKGKALGIATSGLSLTGVVLPYLAMIMLERMSVPRAFLYIGCAILLFSPIAWLIIRNRPEDMGLHPDGGMPGCASPLPLDTSCGMYAANAKARASSHWTLPMLLRETSFWKIGLAYGLMLMGVGGVMFQLKPRFVDIGYDDRTAMALMAMAALAGTIGKYIWAMLCDRFTAKRVAAALAAANGAGLGMGLIADNRSAVLFFVVLYGFAMGGVVSTLPVMIADTFGRDAFASAARFIGFIVGINCLGYPVMGRSFDMTGSYDSAYLLFIALNAIAVILILSLKKPGQPSASCRI